jgi:biopolymer transport protein ExbD
MHTKIGGNPLTASARGCVLLALVTVIGCQSPDRESHRLPAAPAAFRSTDNTLLIELPDSGGVLANGVPIDLAELEPQFHALFSSRPVETRAVFVRAGRRRSWQDIADIERQAEVAGGYAFDADLSGWPRPVQGLPPGQ